MRPRPLPTALILACSILSIGCATATQSPSPGPGSTAAGTTASPDPTPSDAAGVVLDGMPTACYGLGEGDCRRVSAHVATMLPADTPRIVYVQVGPFGCPAGQGCPTTLAARPEGDITLEFAGGAISYHVKVSGGNLEAQRQDAFGIELPPTSNPPVPGAPRPFTLGHCGLWSGIDLGGSWWDPIGLIDADHGDAINAAEGTIAEVGPDRSMFTSKSGFTVQLARRTGPKFLPFCD